jgi:3'(2'), 5'-bisphosphate nucleotidase
MASDDDLLARELAGEAGRRLLGLRAQAGSGDDQASLRKAGDRLAQEFLAAELARRRPADAVLSEEAADSAARLSADRVWIVDPLDGTREFAEPGRSDWAVHVALWERGELTAGAVALPAQDSVLSTAEPPAARPAVEPAAGAPLRLVVSRTRPPAFVTELAGLMGADLLPLGSAGAKIAAVLRGAADAYVHAGGQYEWDSAAPVAVARAAGFHASRIDGTGLAYNQADPLLPDILVCPPVYAARLLDAISSARSAAK